MPLFYEAPPTLSRVLQNGNEATEDIIFGAGTKITSATGEDVNITPSAGGITSIGDAGSTSQGLASNDDLFVSGKVEIDGVAYFDSDAKFSEDLLMSSNRYLASNVNSYGGIYPRLGTQTVNCMAISLGSTSNYILMCETADGNFDFSHSQQTNPTIFLHSANQATDEFLSLSHNQSDAEVLSGKGGVILSAPDSAVTPSGNSQVAMYLDEAGGNLKFAIQESDGSTHTVTLAYD